jgi:uncharacterized protein (DUF1778 family)
MRNPDRVPLQMVIAPREKELIRRLAANDGKSMTRFVLRLVLQEAERRSATTTSESRTS